MAALDWLAAKGRARLHRQRRQRIRLSDRTDRIAVKNISGRWRKTIRATNSTISSVRSPPSGECR